MVGGGRDGANVATVQHGRRQQHDSMGTLARLHFLLLFCSSLLLPSRFFFSPSPPLNVTQIRGSPSKQALISPSHYGTRLHFCGEKTPAFSSLVDSHRTALPTDGRNRIRMLFCSKSHVSCRHLWVSTGLTDFAHYHCTRVAFSLTPVRRRGNARSVGSRRRDDTVSVACSHRQLGRPKTKKNKTL